jgi:hypothetical protein
MFSRGSRKNVHWLSKKFSFEYPVQCWGFGLIECGSGFSISSETGSGSKVLMTKNWKKIQLNFFFIDLFWSKIYIYLSLGVLKGRPSYRRSLQASKENQKMKFMNFFSYFCGSFCPSGLLIRIRGPPLNPDPIRIRKLLTTKNTKIQDRFGKTPHLGIPGYTQRFNNFKPWICTAKGLWPAKIFEKFSDYSLAWEENCCLVEPGLRTSHWECSAWPRLRPTRSNLASSSNTASYRLNPRQ